MEIGVSDDISLETRMEGLKATSGPYCLEGGFPD